MIHAYALEPELVATWGESSQYRYFVEKFGLGTPRALAEFPKFKNWRRRVLSATGPTTELERARIVELVRLFGECRAARDGAEFDGSIPWIENVEREHAERPFDAVLARSFSTERAEFLVASVLGSSSRAAWDVADRVTVGRKPEKMAAAVAAMLRNCTQLLLIDPHFSPTKPQFLRAMQRFLCAAVERRAVPLSRVEIHCKKESQQAGMDTHFFQDQCRALLPGNIPDGVTVVVCRWIARRAPGCSEFHDRFILTDLGGVEASRGLDDDDDPSGPDGSTTRFSLLSREEHGRYWQLYANADQHFDAPVGEVPCTIAGCRRPPGRAIDS